MYKLSSYIDPIDESADWNACWPLRNASTNIVMLPSVSLPVLARRAIDAYAP